ncbi:hypothetical protein MSG28_009331 [Choristoneura fumiferana]|uniref:Uncharacterized protein n=1 Tax=Choristoneura fumiferana TaxID=7141 RepID=A0ACC0KY07_CHOFU|nr:hypothetical protein MSG28_009331 [Choristoneura fumiferana]
MLVTEYLLCMEFSYSLSVFISEIPLANMVFGFAKSLMELGADDKVLTLKTQCIFHLQVFGLGAVPPAAPREMQALRLLSHLPCAFH